jgi:NAD(P)-dependent dehydrogenase (short-subunit alcohol dehydrogenase family)
MSRLSILVTGATDGIGKRTAQILAGLGHNVILHGRSAERLAKAAEDVKKSAKTGCSVDVVRADFSRLEDVRAMSQEVATRFPQLNVLLNNAACMSETHAATADGFELTFGVSHLAPMLLTLELLPLLARSKPSRIVNVSSVAHTYYPLQTIDFSQLRRPTEYDMFRQYSLAKLGNVMFSNELTRRMAKKGITGVSSTSLHPGVIGTKLLNTGFPGVAGSDLDTGAKTSVFCVTAKELEGVSGTYYDKCAVRKISSLAADEALCSKMFDVSCEMLGYATPPL